MNRSTRTALIAHVCAAAQAAGIDKVLNFKDMTAARVRALVGAQFLTPRTHSNNNRNRQRRRRNHLARMLKHASQGARLESALSR